MIVSFQRWKGALFPMTKIDTCSKSQDTALLCLMATSMMMLDAKGEDGSCFNDYLKPARSLLREIDRRYRLAPDFTMLPFGRPDGRELLAVSAAIWHAMLMRQEEYRGAPADAVIDATEETLEQMKHVPRGIVIQM